MSRSIGRRLVLAIALTLPGILITGCGASNPVTANVPPGPDAGLTKVSIGLLDIARGTGVLANSVITANQQGVLSTDNTRLVLGICQKVNTFVGQASMIVRGQANIPPADRQKLSGLINPILQTFQADMNAGLVGITDQTTKTTVSAALLTIQTTLTAIQAFASGGGN